MPASDNRFQSARTRHFTESVIREMTRLAVRHNALNLAQGFPDFAAPDAIKEAACRAIVDDVNQYAITWGAPALRDAIAAKYQRTYSVELDPAAEVTVVCGSTEGMIASLLATTNPDDEIVIFEPFYENYGPDADLCSARRRYVRLQPPDWKYDTAELRAAFTPRTKAVIVNSPHNPTGKVFSRAELTEIAALCMEFNALCITDEIYEHIIYDGVEHVPMLTIPGMRDRTLLINSLSKTYSVTGWRVGWVIAPPSITASIRKVHDFLTVGAAAPLQQAGAVALAFPESYYARLSESYRHRRDLLADSLTEAGFTCYLPRGAYYLMTDYAHICESDSFVFSRQLIEKAGVAAVPGASFYSSPDGGRGLIRFCFCKKYETLEEAGQRICRAYRRGSFPRP